MDDLFLEETIPTQTKPEAKAAQILKTGVLVGAGVIGGSIAADYIGKQFKLSGLALKGVETALGVFLASWAAKKANDTVFYVGLGVAVDGIRGIIVSVLPSFGGTPTAQTQK